MKNVETEAASKKIKKTKEEIIKQLKELIMSDGSLNKDIEESVRNVNNSDEATKVNLKNRKESIIYRFLISFLVHFKTIGMVLLTILKMN